MWFFFYQLQSWHMSLVWHVRRIWPPLPHISHNAVGKDLPYIFNKKYLVHVCAPDTGNFPISQPFLAFGKTLCNPCTSSQYSGDKEHHEWKEKQPSLHFPLYRAAEDSIYRRLLLLIMFPSCNVGFPCLRKNTKLTTSNLQLCCFGTNQTRNEDYNIDRT